MKGDVLEKAVKFYPALDVREPNLSKDSGIGNLQTGICMLLKGEKGVVSFVFNTGVYQREKTEKTHNMPRNGEVDIGYHSYEPFFEWQTPYNNCEFLNGKECYHDGSGEEPYRYLDVLIHKQDKIVWGLLEKYYLKTFYDLNTKASTAKLVV
jgi:hypothetical protein